MLAIGQSEIVHRIRPIHGLLRLMRLHNRDGALQNFFRVDVVGHLQIHNSQLVENRQQAMSLGPASDSRRSSARR